MCGLFNVPIVFLMGLVIIIFVSDPTFVSQPSSCPFAFGGFHREAKGGPSCQLPPQKWPWVVVVGT
jgi:hypothetical protein